MATAQYHQQQKILIESLFAAAKSPSSSKATSSNVYMAVQKIMSSNSHVSDRGKFALANVIEMRQFAMTGYGKGNMPDAGHGFWLNMLISIKSQLEEQERCRLIITRRRLDLDTGRTAVVDRSIVSTSSIDQTSLGTSYPHPAMSLEESGESVIQALGCRTLQSIRNKVAEVWSRAASGTLDIVTAAQVSNICREYADSELQYLCTYHRLETEMLQYPLIAEIIGSSKDRTYEHKIEASSEMFWPPAMRNQADHLVDRWLLLVARNSWNCSDRPQSATKLRLMLLMHVRQLVDIKNHILPADKEQTDRFVRFAKIVLRDTNFQDIWALGHFCAVASLWRSRYEALNMTFSGMRCYILWKASGWVKSEELPIKLIQTLDQRGLLNKIEKSLFCSGYCPQTSVELCSLIKKHHIKSTMNPERLYKWVSDRELSYQLDDETFRPDEIVRHLNKTGKHNSSNDDFKCLIDKIEQTIAQDKKRVGYLCGQEWSDVKSMLGIDSSSATDSEASITRSVPRCDRSFMIDDPDLGA